MSNNTKKLHDLHPLRLLPLVLCLAMVAFFIIRGGITVEDILNYAPDNTWLAVVFLLLVYAAKSLSVAFPIIVLQIAAGHLFVPYGIGRFSGSGLTVRLLVRYPQIDGLIKSQEGHYLFLSFFLRVIYLLPGDVVSMYFGSIHAPYPTILLGGLLGGLPSLLAATLLGASVSQVGSPAFWVALGVTAGVSAISLLGYLLWQKAQKTKA